jgi:hypothetical protein
MNNGIVAPTREDLFDYFISLEELKQYGGTEQSVYKYREYLTTTSRWGVEVKTVFHRPSDNTYWALDWTKHFNESVGDWDEVSPRDIYQVWPYIHTEERFTNKSDEI